MGKYTILDEGNVVTDTATELVKRILAENSAGNKELAVMNAEQYARAMIEDAEYFLPRGLLEALKKVKFDSDYDRALTYLGQMPTSGVKILKYD